MIDRKWRQLGDAVEADDHADDRGGGEGGGQHAARSRSPERAPFANRDQRGLGHGLGRRGGAPLVAGGAGGERRPSGRGRATTARGTGYAPAMPPVLRVEGLAIAFGDLTVL